MHLADPEFPPLYQPFAVKSPDDPVSAALVAIGKGEAEAGSLYWARATSAAHCAIVFEPEHPLSTSAQALVVGMVAIGDAIGAIGPPNLGITYGWPGAIYANGATVGEMHLLAPAGLQTADTPEWLILELNIAIKSDQVTHEPGEDASRTELWEEGAGDLDRTRIIESFSRHLLTWLDTWEADGFRQVHELWVFRAADRDAFVQVSAGEKRLEGTFVSLDDEGGVLIKTENGIEGLALTDAVQFTEAGP